MHLKYILATIQHSEEVKEEQQIVLVVGKSICWKCHRCLRDVKLLGEASRM